MQQKENTQETWVDSSQINKLYLKELLKYRDLFIFLSKKDVLIRYRQAFFGIAWAIIRPIATMTLFALIFGRIAHLSSQNVNYGLFVLSGMIPWQFLSCTMSDAAMSLIGNANLLSKSYFPRLLIPTSQILVNLVDFGVNMLVLAVALIFSSTSLSYKLVFLPFFFLLLLVLSLGLSLWMSALTVKYRDFKILIPFMLQFGIFVSPIGYGSFLIPADLRFFYSFNPLVGIIDGFRWCLFNTTYPGMSYSVSFSLIFSILALISGFFYFRRTENTFVDQL